MVPQRTQSYITQHAHTAECNQSRCTIVLLEIHSILHHLTNRYIKLTSADSLLYLPLADATVITFLAPSLACWACSFLINEPFTRTEQMAAYISLFGVVLIARPVSLFASLVHSSEPVPPATGDDALVLSNMTTGTSDSLATEYDSVTPTQRATAVGIAMIGVLGATGAYTTVRWIGKRAHPLMTVNYLAVMCTIVSLVAMFTVPGVGFLLPQSLKDWCYLIFLGVCGFVMVCTSRMPSNLINGIHLY
jgi:drug/metabolite transporter (DMT)-like permease